ncbi:hypothetical protein ONZ43_g778 [Nemania bipapillata]|uniref:Uncharacterized protein n=1 Tax=Nemania bipapillata TaxID=110536 RepID=A0ACC2J731_9PEZI|nr:hypothetical protein ONZ43_g778 [Nemania bipapillata]
MATVTSHKPRILVPEKVSPDGLALLSAEYEVDSRPKGVSPEELLALIPNVDALIVRSETKVTAAVLGAAGSRLRVVARAGVGVDNIDVEAATAGGIIVVNSPAGNIVAAAEHTVALLLATARNVGRADRTTKEGRWERSKLVGVEVGRKTLGVVGLGKVGMKVARMCIGLGMKVIAFDPYANPDLARQTGVERLVPRLTDMLPEIDFLTIHTPLLASTLDLIGAAEFKLMKPTARVLNVARGGVYNEAALTGKEAGLFVLSGTMGNQIALRSLLTQPPHSVLCDRDSHIVKYEAGGYYTVASLCGALITPVQPSNGRYLTLEDVKKNIILSDNVHACPTRVISLENSLGGMVMPLEEVQRISAFARENGVLMHCDGARLWEVVSSGAGSLTDFCACFDTVSLCFSKGLGAPIGSIVVGSQSLIKQGRWVRKSIGGGLRQSGVVTAAARVAVDVTFGTDSNGQGGLLKATHATARRVEKMWTDLGGRMEHPVETNMCWLDLESLGCSAARFEQLGREVGLKLMGNRLITHYQIGEEAIQKLAVVFQQIANESTEGIQSAKAPANGIYGQ